MDTIASRFPEFIAALRAELNAAGRLELAEQLQTAEVLGVSFDPEADAGYITVEAGRELNVVEANIVGVRHGETIAVDATYSAYLDTDNFGRLTGVEVLSPPSGLKALLVRQAAV
jgi:uncharacterized protein YuzE